MSYTYILKVKITNVLLKLKYDKVNITLKAIPKIQTV